jgi:hypothetical protein
VHNPTGFQYIGRLPGDLDGSTPPPAVEPSEGDFDSFPDLEKPVLYGRRDEL